MSHHPRIPVAVVHKRHYHKSISLSIGIVVSRYIELVMKRNAIRLHYGIWSYWFSCGRYLQTLPIPRRWSLHMFFSKEKWTAYFDTTMVKNPLIWGEVFFLFWKFYTTTLLTYGGFTVLTHIILYIFKTSPRRFSKPILTQFVECRLPMVAIKSMLIHINWLMI